jgi:hypothetical protein
MKVLESTFMPNKLRKDELKMYMKFLNKRYKEMKVPAADRTFMPKRDLKNPVIVSYRLQI